MKSKAEKTQSPKLTPAKETGKTFNGIQHHAIKILKPGTVNPTETLRSLRG
jgi:hypothetical protein